MAFKDFPTAAESSHTDANQQFSLVAVQGTLGTADVTGSARTVPLGANPVTGALYVESTIAAGGGGTTVTVDHGTITITNPGSGGTFNNISTGTQQTLGTVGVVNNIVTGTLAQVTSVSNLVSGTLLSSGTTTGVGVVSALTTGSVTMTVGTVTTGTLQNLVTGTINALAAGTITGGTLGNLNNGTLAQVTSVSNLVSGTLLSSGTITGVGVVTSITNLVSGTLLNSGTTTGVGVVSNLTNGSINLLTGTVTSVTNLANGTVHRDHTPVNIGTSIVTNGTTGAAVWGTLVATSGNGIKQYVTGLQIVVSSGTVDVAITNIGIGGSSGAGVLARGVFPAGGGITREFDPNIPSGTGGTIAYWLGGAGTVNVGVTYWQGA